MHLVVCILASLTLGADDARLHIEATDGGRMVTVIARFADGDVTFNKEQLLTLQLIGDDGELGPPIFGKYRRVGTELRFTPKYRLIPEYDYRANYHAPNGPKVHLDYRVPKRASTKAASVERVYPSTNVLPANHLKFYILFTQPMREGRAVFDRIHLLNEDGSRVLDPWRRTELWTEDARRLTLWIHPGRVKTGVNLREELGPVLEPGRRYTLLIEAELQDLDGKPLQQSFKKRFETRTADRKRIEPQDWQLTTPTSGTRQPLEIRFNESLDYALSRRFISVLDSRGNIIDGEKIVGRSEATLSFTPKSVWDAGEYQILVDPLLEDLAGNTAQRIFDTDLAAPALAPPILTVTFRTRTAP